jgi:hypothetical protein
VCGCDNFIKVLIVLKIFNQILLPDHTLHVKGTGPITVAARSKARNVFARSSTGIVGSNPTRGMDVFVLSCVGSGLATGLSHLPVVYKKNSVALVR